MTIFYTSDGRAYSGMTQEVIQKFLDDEKKGVAIVDKDIFDVSFPPKVEKLQSQIDAAIGLSQDISTVKNKGKTPDERIDALIKVLGI